MKNTANNRFAYPMPMLNSFLTEDEIAKYAEKYDFDRSEQYFHLDTEKEMLESLSAEDIAFYNANVPTNKKILVYGEEMTKVA